jgi:hypothetical protein
MYIYQNHLSGELYSSKDIIDYDDLYCETCGDSDSLVAKASCTQDLLEQMADDIAGGYDLNYILQFASDTFD